MTKLEVIDGEPQATPRSDPIAEITLQPGMGAIEYACLVTEQQSAWNSAGGIKGNPKIFTDIVSRGIDTLLLTQPTEEIKTAQIVFIEFTQKVQDPAERGDRYDYISWFFKLRQLAGLSTSAATRPLQVYKGIEDHSYSSEDFWRDVYYASIDESRIQSAIARYILAHGIEAKNPGFLYRVAEELDKTNAFEILCVPDHMRTSEGLSRIAFDCFSRLLKEAGEAGWEGASSLTKRLRSKLRQTNSFVAITNSVGNVVTDIMNRSILKDDEKKLEYFDANDRKAAASAVYRCLDFVIGYNSPASHEPLNYELTGRIVAKLLDESARLFDEERKVKSGQKPILFRPKRH